MALPVGRRARTTSSDTWGLPPPGTTTPTAPLENPWIGVRGGASRRRPTRAGTSGGKRAERERKESGKRAGGRDGELSARLRRDEHFGDTCGGSGLELPIARPYGSREIQGDREEVMTREKNVLILGAPRSKVRLPSTPGGNAGPKKGAPKEETS